MAVFVELLTERFCQDQLENYFGRQLLPGLAKFVLVLVQLIINPSRPVHF